LLYPEDRYIVMVTKKGIINRVPVNQFDNPRPSGLNAIELQEGDELLAARISDDEHYLLLASHEGTASRFHENEVRARNRDTRTATGNGRRCRTID